MGQSDICTNIRCDCCGKFAKLENLKLINVTPDSAYSFEDYYYRCLKCEENK